MCILIFLVFSALATAQTFDKRSAPVDASIQATFEKRSRIALLVGVGNYSQASGLSTLRFPARDVALLGAELEKQGYRVRMLVDTDATRGVVLKVLRELAADLNHDQGTFLFYFSGHGFSPDGANYLATFGSTEDGLKEEGLPVAEVESILKASHARQAMMFIDACRSAPAGGPKSGEARSFVALNASQGLRVLNSTAEGHVSYESEDLRQGVFTYFLVQGLRGKAAGQDGMITFHDLTDYVIESVRAWGVSKGKIQLPYERGESSGDFLLARVAVVPPAPVPAPPTLPTTPPPVVAPVTPMMVGKVDVSHFAGVRPGDPADRATTLFGNPWEDRGKALLFGVDSVGLTVFVDPPRGDSRIVGAKLYRWGAQWVRARAGSDSLMDLLEKSATEVVAALGPPAKTDRGKAKNTLIWRLPQGGELTVAVESGRCSEISLNWSQRP